MTDLSIAKALLGKLDRDVVPIMKQRGAFVKELVDNLQFEIRKKSFDRTSPLKGATVIHGGSAYEGLAVNNDVDFDLIVILGKLYASENFHVHRTHDKFFNLKWKQEIIDKGYSEISDENGFLNVANLRKQLFHEIIPCLYSVPLNGAKIQHKEGTAALILKIYLPSDDKISIDLVPHIVFHSWDQCPDLKPKHEMPLALIRYIDTLNENASPVMFFNLAVPHRDDPLICNVSFALLEKRFVTSDVQVRSMVRLVKYVGDRCEWKKNYGFQSYFAKRMAVKHHDTLKSLDMWNGYKAILMYLYKELESGTVDGYFIKNQVTYMRTKADAVRLQWAINKALTMSAREIYYLC